MLATETVLASTAVDDCRARVRAAGYRAVVTSPLAEPAARALVTAGFERRERLHLLAHRLGSVPRPELHGPTLRRAWRSDHPFVLDVDRRAFEPAWQLGEAGLREALHATPSVRFRVGCRAAGAPIAYAITGRAGDQGYLQRLAVDPSAHGLGFGRALVRDALRWLRRASTRRCLVNTQQDNVGALALYEACGFERLPAGLVVLSCDL